ncbi:MAG: SDR family NAD(P)-dependent oxidoreductase [Anaerovoracaceae bacterium]|jgi:NAD(P)-dependent dehydrogenase (short-subunit alcohol dehydrogenase family)
MRIWFITGCSSGLGQGIAGAVLKSGDCAVVTARKKERVEHFAAEYPGRALAVPLDLAKPETLRAAVAEACERFGRIDVLVNNAGHGYRAAIEESDPDQVHRLFEEVFFAPMELIKLVLPKMRAQRHGLLLCVTSIGAVRGALGNGYYSAAKGALELAVEALQKEIAPFGIRTMLIEPGAMRTGFFGERMEGTGISLSAYDSIAAKYRKEQIRDRHDQPGDPDKCGELIVRTALLPQAPFRLLLGSDAVRAAEATLQERLRELRAWKDTSTQSDFD